MLILKINIVFVSVNDVKVFLFSYTLPLGNITVVTKMNLLSFHTAKHAMLSPKKNVYTAAVVAEIGQSSGKVRVKD